MGMFDTVVIEGLKLPKLPKEVAKFLSENNSTISSNFQTKDLDNSLSTYKIDDKGQIWQETRKPTGRKVPFKPFDSWRQKRPFLERVYFKALEYSDKTKRIPAKIPEYKIVFVKSNLTQAFEIGSYNEINGRYLDIGFTVEAVSGKVKSIKVQNWSLESKNSAAKRHKESSIFEKNMNESFERQRAFRSKWYYPVIRETYTPFVFFARIIVQKICNKIISWSNRWTGV